MYFQHIAEIQLSASKKHTLDFSDKNFKKTLIDGLRVTLFWNDFFNVFGISRRRVASFEQPIKKADNKQGFIDLLWKGTILVEHKSKGKDLEKATQYPFVKGFLNKPLSKENLAQIFAS